MQCLQKAITPPTVGWEEARREAYEAGALDAITSVLTKHKADLAVLSSSTACLKSIASEPKYAGDLARSGALVGMLNAVEQQPDATEGVQETLELLETVATYNPQALLEAGGCDAVVGLMRMAGKEHTSITKSCVAALENMNKCPDGGAALRDSGIVPDLLDAVREPVPEGASSDNVQVIMVETSFRLLERMTRSADHADFIRESCDGMKALSSALEVHSKNERLCKVGGRLLTKLAAGNVPDLVKQMKSASDPKQKAFLSSLLANLALEEETAERIVESGGVSVLLSTLGASSPGVISSSARAIARIAADPSHIAELVSGGAVGSIVAAMKAHPDDAEVAAAVMPTLLKLASSPENTTAVARAGGVDAVLAALATHFEVPEAAAQGLAFLENLGMQDFDVAGLKDVAETATRCVVANPDNKEVQLNGMRVLIMVAGSEVAVDDIVGADGLDAAVAAVQRAAKGISPTKKEARPTEEDEAYFSTLASAALYLLGSLCVVDGHRVTLSGNATHVDVLLRAVARFAGRPAVRDSATDLLEMLADEDVVRETWSSLEAKMDNLLDAKSPAAARAVEEAILKCAALSLRPQNAEAVVRESMEKRASGEEDDSGLGVLVRAIRAVATTSGVPRQDVLLSAASNALFGINDCVEKDEELRAALGESGAVEAVISAIAKNPKLTQSVGSGIKFLQSFSTIESCARTITKEHGIEACAAVLRANPTDADIIGAAVETMLRISTTDEGAIAVAQHGGTRQVIATIHANTNTPGFAPAMASCMSLLQRVAITAKGAETLSKQGAVDAVLAAAESGQGSAAAAAAAPTSSSGSSGSGAASASSGSGSSGSSGSSMQVASGMTTRMLSRLLTEDDVHNTLDEFEELARTVATGKVPSVESVRPALAKLGHIATVSTFADAIAEREGLTHLATVLTAVALAKDASKDTIREVLPTAFTALANVSRGAAIPESLDVSQMVVTALSSGIAVPEALQCVAALARDETVAVQLAGGGEVASQILELTSTLLRTNLRNADITTAAFGALAAAAEHASVAATLAASDVMPLLREFLEDVDATTDAGAVAQALNLMKAVVANSPEHARALTASGGVELMKHILTTQAIDSKVGNSVALAGAVEVLHGMVQHSGSAALEAVRACGAIKKVVRAVESHGEYVSSGGSMAATIAFFGRCAEADASTVEDIVAAGGNELVIAGMNKNGTDAVLVSSGARTLSALGTGAEVGTMSVEEVQALSATVEGCDVVTVEDVAALGASVQKLGNMALLEGVVTEANAASVMDTLSRAVALMAESEVASAEVMAAGVQSIGRLAAMGLAARIDDSIVEQVLDVMSMAEDSAVVRNSSMHTLAQLAKVGGMEVVNLMSELGALEAITEMQRAHAGDAELQTLAAATLGNMTETVIQHAAVLVGRAGGSETLFSVVAANASDPTALASCVERIVAGTDGREAVWSVLQAAAAQTAPGATSSVSAGALVDVISEGVRVLVGSFAEEVEASGADGVTFTGTARAMAGLSAALAKAVQLQGALTDSSDQRSRVMALRLAEDTLGLLAASAPDAMGATAFARGHGMSSLIGLLEANITDPETTSTLLNIVLNIAKAGSPAAAQALAKPETMGAIVNAIKTHPGDEGVCADAIESAYFVAQVVGADQCGLDREALRLIGDAMSDHAESERVKAAAVAVMDKMASVFSDEPAKLMTRTLAATGDAIDAALAIEQHTGDDGKTYYVNTATGETLQEAPKAFTLLRESVMATAELSRGQADDEVVTADTAVIRSLCAAMQNFAGSADVAQAAAETLSTLSQNARNTASIAENGGIKAIIAAVRAQPDRVELVKLLLVLLERISRNDAYKSIVAAEGGVDVVIATALGRHYRDEDLATRGLSTLANLAFNSEENTEAIVAAGGIESVEKCMQAHRAKPRTLEAAVCALSNIMFSSDEIKVAVGQAVGDELTLLIDDYAKKDASLVKMALRALGNCTYTEENVRYVAVENHATSAIVNAMRGFRGDAELLQISCEVLANFASLEEEGPPDELEGMARDEWMTVQRVVFEEEGAAEVLNAVQRMQSNSAVVKAGMDALHNICSDLEVAAEAAETLAIVPTLIDLGRQFDWDADLLEHLMPLLATLAESPEAAAAIVRLDGIPVIISALEQHGMETAELLFAGQLALSSLAVHESARAAFSNSNAVESLIALVRDHSSSAESGGRAYITEALTTLTRMCATDELSLSIAQDGLHSIMGVAEDHREDAELLTGCLRLITHLSFVEANLKAIIQSGGLNLLINAVVDHPDSRELVLRAVRGIDAVAMSSKENAALVIEEGGQDLLEDVLDSYPDDDEIQRAGKSAILSMSALDQLKKSERLGHKAARAAKKSRTEAAADPLGSARSKLSAGRVMSVWTKGTSKPAHVLAAPDFRSIVWQDARSKEKMGALDLRSVVEVNAGTGPDHKKRLLGRAADPTKCLCIVGERTTLCLEATNKGQAVEWVEAFSQLLRVFKTDPAALG